jgi:hypothetical protein
LRFSTQTALLGRAYAIRVQQLREDKPTQKKALPPEIAFFLQTSSRSTKWQDFNVSGTRCKRFVKLFLPYAHLVGE